jgi:hypothetical protein
MINSIFNHLEIFRIDIRLGTGEDALEIVCESLVDVLDISLDVTITI